jgi:hypothetical protein
VLKLTLANWADSGTEETNFDLRSFKPQPARDRSLHDFEEKRQ